MRDKVTVAAAALSALAIISGGFALYVEYRIASERYMLIEDIMRRIHFFDNTDKRLYLISTRINRVEDDVRELNGVILSECMFGTMAQEEEQEEGK